MTATRERIRTPRWVWPVVGALLLAQAVVLALWPAAHLLMIDLQVYRAGGEHLLTGTSLYDGGVLLDLPFVYPPFAALVFVPLTVLPLPVLKLAWTLAGVALVVFVVRRSADLVGMRASPAGDRAAGGGAARARPDPYDVLPGTDQRRAARPGARRRHRAAGAAARGRGGARGGGEAHAAGLRRLPGAHRPGAGRGDGAGDVRRGGRCRVPRRAGGLGHLLVRGHVRRRRPDLARRLDGEPLARRPARAGRRAGLGRARRDRRARCGGAGGRGARPPTGRGAARGDAVRAAVGGGRAVRVVAPLRVVRAAGRPARTARRDRGPAGGRRARGGPGRHAGVGDPTARARCRADPEHRADLAAARRLPRRGDA